MRLVLGLALLCLTSPVLPATSLPALPRPPLALFHSDLSSAPVSDPFRHDLLGSSCYFPQGELQDWDAGMLLAAGQTSPVPKQQNVFATLPPITIAALSTATLMYPVDLVRALRMSAAAEGHAKPTVELLQNFYREHGLKGFATQGVVPEMVRATYMRILKFFLFPIVHEGIFKKSEKDGTGLTKAVAGAIASVPEAITIQPIEISKIALQLDKNNVYKNNAISVIKDIIKTRGWPGLYAGFPGLQYRQLSWTAAYFASLRHFQEQSSHIIPDDMKMLQQFAGGFAAGIFGAVFNTPGDVIRSVRQRTFLASVPKREVCSFAICSRGLRHLVGTGATIVQQKGLTGLYTGFGFKALHLGGSGALLALLVPTLKTWMGVE